MNVVPSEGALVVADFKAHTGLRALVTLLYHHKPVPFGATVSRSDSQNATIVGDDGQAYMLSMPLSGDLQVQWGDDADQQCKVHYQVPESEMNKPLTQFKAECQ